MRIIFITKCLFIYFSLTCDKNLVESAGSTANPNPGTEGGTSVTTPASGSTDLSNKTGVELSLKATAATDQFNYNKDGRIVTYTAKDSFGFKSVKTGDKLIWEAKDKKYADSVTLYGKGKKSKSVTINIPNGINMAYVRNGKGKPWQEYDLSKTNPVCINVYIERDTCVYTYKKENSFGTFTPKEGFAFKEVIRDGWKIWNTSGTDYPTKVEFDGNARAKIHFKDGSVKEFKLGANEWNMLTGSSKKGNGTDTSGGGTQQATPAAQ